MNLALCQQEGGLESLPDISHSQVFGVKVCVNWTAVAPLVGFGRELLLTNVHTFKTAASKHSLAACGVPPDTCFICIFPFSLAAEQSVGGPVSIIVRALRNVMSEFVRARFPVSPSRQVLYADYP